ncbi:MAG: inorganic diphosphatase [Candidatus Aenigmarchaeota archaeon]|nr:inorganic diphosphatase [Candidatus Aenigmarchaeota archaeon]
MNKTNAKEYLNEIVTVSIDRPLGSKHPKHEIIYKANYGFVPNTKSADGEELDAYVLGVEKPLKEFTGRCIAIIHRLDDDDDKLVVVPEDVEFSDNQILEMTNFVEKYFKPVILRK